MGALRLRAAAQSGGAVNSRHVTCKALPGRLADHKAAQDSEFAQLLTPIPSDVYGGEARARSASDAGVLRRKGRLKEQDQLIDFIVEMHKTHTCEEAMAKLQRWVQVCGTSTEPAKHFDRCMRAHLRARWLPNE